MVNVTPTPPPELLRKQNGMGTTGFVLGLLAALFSLIPLIGVIAWPLSILGLIFGILGILRVSKDRADNKGLAITGTVLAAIGLLICLLWTIAVGIGANNVAAQSPVGAAPAPSSSDDETADHAFGDTQVWPGGLTLEVSPPSKHKESNPYLLEPGTRAVEVDLTITNNTSSEINPLLWNITALHGGRPAEPIFDENFSTNAQIPAGGSVTLTRAFKVLPDPGELQLSVQPGFFTQDTAYFRGQF